MIVREVFDGNPEAVKQGIKQPKKFKIDFKCKSGGRLKSSHVILGEVTCYPRDPYKNGIVEDLDRFDTMKDA